MMTFRKSREDIREGRKNTNQQRKKNGRMIDFFFLLLGKQE